MRTTSPADRLTRRECLSLCVGAWAVSTIGGRAAIYPPVQWVVFVDELHLQFRATGHHRLRVRTTVDTLLQEGDAVTLCTCGPSPSELGPTASRIDLHAAIRKVTGNGLMLQDVTADPGGRELASRASISLRAARAAINRLASDDDVRRAMVFVSDGFGVSTSAHAESTAFASDARRARVRVFTVEGDVLEDAAAAAIDAPRQRAYAAEQRGSLDAIAAQTGGFLVRRDDDLPEALARIGHTVRAAPLPAAPRR